MNADPQLIGRIIALALGGWLVAVWVAGAGYVIVSYTDSARRLPRRPFSESMRWIARECWLVLWTQPLMPFFQLFGERMGTGGGAVPVVLVHGYFQNRVDFLYLARRLRSAGSGPLYAFNFLWPQNLEASSKQLHAFVEHVCAATGAEAVDLLTHSAGGLLALDLVADMPETLRKVATIAIPAGGVPWQGPVLGRSGSQLRVGSLYQTGRSKVVDGVPVLSAYSAHDNIVHPVSTSELVGDQVRNFEVDGPGHLSVLFDHAIADEIVAFLTG